MESFKNIAKIVVKRIASAILTSPITWIIVGLLFIILIIICMFMGGSQDADAASADTDSMSSTSSEGFEQLVRWNAYMEHGIDIATYDKDYYEYLSDGFGGVAILGLDTRWYGDHFRNLGYSTSVGTRIPRDVVESYYRQVLRDMYEEVKAKVTANGCNMTEYQLY